MDRWFRFADYTAAQPPVGIVDWEVQVKECEPARATPVAAWSAGDDAFRAWRRSATIISAMNVLDRIVAHKRQELAAAREQTAAPIELAALASPVRDFAGALRASAGVGLIAEVKRASPSAGLIREDFDPVAIARTYESAGASCISVLTDREFFQGSLDDLRSVRETVGLPVLRKDFILDPRQILEARAAGADCVLLIAECLNDEELRTLFDATTEQGMQALIEIYEPDNLDRVLRLQPTMIGVNNRNLKTFVTDLEHTIRLSERIPDDLLLVAESGIRTREDVMRLQNAGVAAMLVGETLMRADDIAGKVHELLRD